MPFTWHRLESWKANTGTRSVPVGHNTLQLTVPRLCSSAGIEGYKTNHSLRVTAATRLYQAGVDEQLIMKRTGHRSIMSIRLATRLRLYKRVSDIQEQAVSAILQHDSSATSTITTATSVPQDSSPPPLKQQKTTDMLPLALNLSNCTNITLSIQKHKPSYGSVGIKPPEIIAVTLQHLASLWKITK